MAYDKEAKLAIICEALKNGSTKRSAAAVAGISEPLLYLWIDESIDIRDAITQAENDCEAAMAAVLVKSSAADWRAAESWLKRRRKDEWGDKHDVTSNGETLGVIGYDITPPGTGAD